MRKILLLIPFFLCTSVGLAQQVPAAEGIAKISVTGDAVVNVQPNQIIVTVGVETRHTDLMQAKEKNNKSVKKTFEFLTELDIPEKNIQTGTLSIEPRFTNNYNQQEAESYIVRNMIVITLTDPALVEEVISGALKTGMNNVQGIQFQTTEYKKYREQARVLALKAAREKATLMAGALESTVGKPLQITENASGSFYYSSWNGWGGSQGMSQISVQAGRGDSPETVEVIALGKLAIRASVSVTFELKN